MRGADEQPGSMFSYVSLEERVPARSSAAGDSAHHRSRARAALAAVRHAVYPFRAAVDSARAAVARVAAAGALHDPQRAAVDGAAGLQPAVSLVRGPGDRRRGVGADDLHEESRSAAGRRHRGGVLRRGPDPRRHRRGCSPTSTSPSMARCSRRGRVRRASGRATRSRRRTAASNPTVNFHGQRRTQRDASVDDRSRRAAVQEGAGPRSPARLLGPCADGASLGPDRADARSRRPMATGSATRRS